MKKREHRIATRATARLKHGVCWSDVIVGNVSRRGVMLELRNPPARGTFVELRRGDTIVIGQVLWVRDGRCGVRAQDPIDLTAFLAAHRAGLAWQPGDGDRRARPRPLAADRAVASQLFARVAQWMGVSLITLVGVYTIVSAAHTALAAPMAKISHALARSEQ